MGALPNMVLSLFTRLGLAKPTNIINDAMKSIVAESEDYTPIFNINVMQVKVLICGYDLIISNDLLIGSCLLDKASHRLTPTKTQDQRDEHIGLGLVG